MIILTMIRKVGFLAALTIMASCFLGGNGSGYNLPNTQENVEYILVDFEFWTK